MTSWIPWPAPPLVVAASPPMLVVSSELTGLKQYVARAEAHVAEADVSDVTDTVGVVGALKAVLPFPDWCASGWDSIDDAFEELRTTWPFPLMLVLRGYVRLLTSHQHVALETAIRLNEVEHAFSAIGHQLLVAFEGRTWT
jgi:hypothetical protein